MREKFEDGLRIGIQFDFITGCQRVYNIPEVHIVGHPETCLNQGGWTVLAMVVLK